MRAFLAAATSLVLVALVVPGVTGVAAAEAACSPTAATPTVTVLNPSVEVGGVLRIRGAGWCHPTDGGSTIGIKIDLGAYNHLDTAVHPNRSVWAIVDAGPADGTFTAAVQLPDGTAATSAPVFPLGSHTLQLLSGSLKAGDTVRTLQSAAFNVVAADTVVPDPPDWTHQTLVVGGATAWVESDLPAGATALRVKGVGWTHPTGGASTVAVKLGAGPDGEQHLRSGSAVVAGDATIWRLLQPGNPLDALGSFEATLDLPAGLAAGDYLTAALFSGKFATGDQRRTATTTPLTIGGTAWTGDDDESDVECAPTSTRPTVRLASTSASYGGVLRISGAGWCNPQGGGSRIAVKIDEGTYSRVDDAVASNRTIWQVIEARATDGTFTADIRLPDGTARTSVPALPRGGHTLRLLSGSLAAGDTVRSIESGVFSVGPYRPTGIPDPVAKARLNPGTRDGVTARLDGRRLHVQVPGGSRGDWVFLSAYSPDGSPRYPWNDRWRRLGAGGRLTTGLGGTPATGPTKLVVQSGELGRSGRLLGWAPVRFAAPATLTDPTTDPTTDPATGPAPAPGPVAVPAPTTGAAEPPAAAPTASTPPGSMPVTPAAAAYADLLLDDRLPGALDGTVLTVRLPASAGDQPVYVRVYDGTDVVPAGWVRPDAAGRIRVDLAALPAATYRVSVQDTSGDLLGWSQADLVAPVAAGSSDNTAVAAPAALKTVVPVAADDLISSTDLWLLGLGGALLAGAALGTAGRRRGVA